MKYFSGRRFKKLLLFFSSFYCLTFSTFTAAEVTLNPIDMTVANSVVTTISEAVAAQVGQLLIFPIKELVVTLDYLFNSHAIEPAIKTQSRFIELPYVDSMIHADVDNTQSMLTTLAQNASINTQATLSAENVACTTNSSSDSNAPPCFPTGSAQTLLDGLAYSSDQENAAAEFLKIASGSYIAATPPSASWFTTTPTNQAIAYAAFYKTMQAIQSLANYNLSFSHAWRTADSQGLSGLQLSENIATGDAVDPGFWEKINSLPVISQLTAISNSMQALAIQSYQQVRLLEMINNSLAVLLVEQSFVIQNMIGTSLYQQAQNAATSSTNSNAIQLPAM
jgi:hypothetical protein